MEKERLPEGSNNSNMPIIKLGLVSLKEPADINDSSSKKNLWPYAFYLLCLPIPGGGNMNVKTLTSTTSMANQGPLQ